MLTKQLITLAAVLGILCCGACFLPGDYAPPPPPPAIVIDRHGIHEIAIEASCEPQSGPVRCSGIASQIRDSFNARKPRTGIGAHLESGSGSGDASFTISVSIDDPVPDTPLKPGKEVEWKLPIRVSSRLVRRDGTVIWSERSGDYSYDLFSKGQTPKEVWANRRLHGWAEEWVGQAIVSQLLYGKRYK